MENPFLVLLILQRIATDVPRKEIPSGLNSAISAAFSRDSVVNGLSAEGEILHPEGTGSSSA
jgi:hypothetical protein